MEKKTDELIYEAIAQVKAATNTRETALVVTKLEEALMWLRAHENKLSELRKNSGVGIT